MDYSSEVNPARLRVWRYLLIITGTICLVLGIIGIFLPILPTTPFLLLTAACYARSSSRFYNMLMNNRFFGNYIHTWRNEKRIPLGAKIFAVCTIVLTIGTSVLFFIPLLPVKILVTLIGTAVIIYICRFPS